MPKFELPDSIDNALENATDELTQNVGKTFGDIWFLVFGGISLAADKRRARYEHALAAYRQGLTSSIDKIPAERRIEPSLQITAQALENSKYCIEEEELRQMFISLVSGSMDADLSGDVHPSFAEIIKQMSVLDAKILKRLKISSAPGGLPVCDYCVSHPKNDGYNIVLKNAFLGLPEVSLQACATSISSLERLGLIQIPPDVHLANLSRYIPFERHPQFQLFQDKFPDGRISIQKKVAMLTPLGQSFVKVCIPD